MNVTVAIVAASSWKQAADQSEVVFRLMFFYSVQSGWRDIHESIFRLAAIGTARIPICVCDPNIRGDHA